MSSLNKNLVLIGMPGCGKTTAGRLSSQKLNLSFIDLDEYIEKSTGQTIPQLFEKGEDHFRSKEHEAVLSISEAANTIIATGGGIIKRRDNIDCLCKNGIIVFIDRTPEAILMDLASQGRPLLRENPKRIYDLYNERYRLYNKYCDYKIENSGSMDQLVELLVRLYNEKCKGECL